MSIGDILSALLGHNMATTFSVLFAVGCILAIKYWAMPEIKKYRERAQAFKQELDEIRENPPIHENQITQLAEKMDQLLELTRNNTSLMEEFESVKSSLEEIAQSVTAMSKTAEETENNKAMLVDIKNILQLVHETNASLLHRVSTISAANMGYSRQSYAPGQDDGRPTYPSSEYPGAREIKR